MTTRTQDNAGTLTRSGGGLKPYVAKSAVLHFRDTPSPVHARTRLRRIKRFQRMIRGRPSMACSSRVFLNTRWRPRTVQSRVDDERSNRGDRVTDILIGKNETMAKQTERTMGSQLDRQILRGVLGGTFGGKR